MYTCIHAYIHAHIQEHKHICICLIHILIYVGYTCASHVHNTRPTARKTGPRLRKRRSFHPTPQELQRPKGTAFIVRGDSGGIVDIGSWGLSYGPSCLGEWSCWLLLEVLGDDFAYIGSAVRPQGLLRDPPLVHTGGMFEV